MRTISNEQKIYELSRIWKDAEYNFAFWDKVNIDWDEEYKKALPRVLATEDIYDYYRELARFVALLGDGHTGITFPMEFMQSPEYFSMLPVYLVPVGGEYVVMSAAEEYKDAIPPFSVLTKHDGVAITEYIREKCYPYIWHANEAACGKAVTIELLYGRAGSEAILTFEKDGKAFDVSLRRVDATQIKWCDYGMPKAQAAPDEMILNEESVRIKITEDRIAVITVTTFMDDSVPGKIYGKFEELRKAKGYVIDVRGNGGGNSSNADAVAAMFIPGPFESCAAETQVYEPTYKAWGLFREDFKNVTPEKAAEMHWDEDSLKSYRMCRHISFQRESNQAENNAPGLLEGPVAVLMNGDTVSAAEDFVDVMKMHTKAVFVGGNTAGTSGQPYFVFLESGGNYRICTRRCIAQNGEDIYNKGFSPDIRVAVTLADLTEGCDRAMETGLEVVREKGNFRG
ncbi:MAG: hypothetical protein K6B39_05545 [Lachnospiraceae bacterium]|nr:hypothetical protein [Lachnospiraceae bacterium]